jgi:hypothetical protein
MFIPRTRIRFISTTVEDLRTASSIPRIYHSVPAYKKEVP